MDDIDNPLGAFLRARRERVDPADHGIRDGGRRRVPGLRREELAFLAGVSAPYYARLEQGRDRSPSPEVLDAIASVLRLDAEAVAHLHRLGAPVSGRAARLGNSAGGPPDGARHDRTRSGRTRSGGSRIDGTRSVDDARRIAASGPVSPLVRRLLDEVSGCAALVVGRHRDVLAANPLATVLYPGFESGRNLVRDTFLDPVARQFYVDWHEVALGAVAGLRASAGRQPDDPALRELVGELSLRSDDFRTMWARHDVHAKTTGTKRYRHPDVGGLELEYQTFDVNGSEGQVLHVFSAEPGSPSADGLALLALAEHTRA